MSRTHRLAFLVALLLTAPAHAQDKNAPEPLPEGATEPTGWIAIESTDSGGRRPFRPDAVVRTYLLGVGGAAPTVGDELRMIFSVRRVKDDAMTTFRPRILGRVTRVLRHTWGSLVDMEIAGATPPEDFEVFRDEVAVIGRYAVR